MNFNYFSGLFSGLSNNSGNSFYASLSDYSSIKSGSYKKLLNAYYDTKSGKTSSAAGDILIIRMIKKNGRPDALYLDHPYECGTVAFYKE